MLLISLLDGGAQEHREVPVSVPFQLEHGLVFLEVEMPGRGPLLALLDTGASASAVDPRVSGDLAVAGTCEVVGTTGVMDVEMVKLEGLRLATRELPELSATRRDLSGLLAPEGRAVDMILGSDAFRSLVVTLDFTESRLEVVEHPAEGLPEGVPMILDNGIPAIEAQIGGLDLWLRIDTGASLFDTQDVYVNVPAPVWNALCELHEDLEPTTQLRGTGAGGETVDLPVAPVMGARIGPLELDRVFVIVQPEAGYFADSEAKGFLGNNYLRRLARVTLDYRNGRLRARNEGGQ